MTTDRIALSMLDVTFEVTSNDERMSEFVRLFWEPFLSAGPAPEGAVGVSVGRSHGLWTVQAGDVPRNSADDPWIVGSALRNLLTLRAIKGSPGVMPLHSSVVERDGVYVVLAGQPMAGKTTLTLELLERGWRYVSDDMAPIDAATGLAHPFPKALSVRDPARWAAFRDRWEVPEWLPAPSNASLIPAAAFAWAEPAAYRPDLVLFPRYVAGAPGAVETLPTGRAMVLCGENLQDRTALKQGGLGKLAEWTGAASAASIEYGSTDVALELFGNCLAGSAGDGIIS